MESPKKRVRILGRVRSFVTKEVATVVHNALILPLFDYCDIAWSNLLQQDIDRLQRLQNRSARIITRCSRSSEAIEQQLHWPTLSSRHKAKLVFICRHSLVPSYFSLYFTIFSNIHNYSARQSMRLSLPNVKQNFGKRTWRKNKLVFICRHSLVPSYFSLYFTIFSNIHNYSARQSMRLSLPNVKQNFGKRTWRKNKLVFICRHSLVPSYFSLYFTIFSNIHNYSARQSMRLSLPNVKQNFGKRTWCKNSLKRRTSCE